MTVTELKREYDVCEADLRECAELLGIKWAEEYEQRQADALALAVLLQRLEFHPERIQRCCVAPEEFLKHLQTEIREGQQNRELKELLEEIRDLVDESWCQDVDPMEMLLSEVHLLWQLHDTGGAGFATVSLMPTVIIFLIALVIALLLRPVIVDLIRPVLSGIL